jgi:hypothetical protein
MAVAVAVAVAVADFVDKGAADMGPRSHIGIQTRALVYLLRSKLDRLSPEAQRKQKTAAAA